MDNIKPKEIITGGILAGCMIEFSLFLKREERYKNVFKYVRGYPGFSLATCSAVFGLGWMYGRLAINKFNFKSKEHQ